MPAGLKYKFDQFEADVNAAELRRNGGRLKLQMQPFQVLVALLERPGEVVTREELRVRLWPQDTFVDFDHSLNTAIAKLRDALGDSAGRPRYIETIAKRGYRFLGEAVVHGQPTASSPTAMAAEVKPGELELPRAGRGISRSLFILVQVMYLIFYLSALFDWHQLDRAAVVLWPRGAPAVLVTYLITALLGIVVRLYLITATALDYHLFGEKYRVLFPWLFLEDMIWAAAPMLLADRMGWGLALGAMAALVYLPFAQRVLVKMIGRRA
jgi:cholera toxin transcriptional activator